MKKPGSSTLKYEVEPNEQVTFEITPSGTSRTGITASSGDTLNDTNPSGTPTYSFTVTGAVGSRKFAKFEFHFGANDPADAKFAMVVSGSKGGRFELQPVSKELRVLERTIQFTIVSPT